ncbi:MAG: hypothetical protein HY521_14935 [Proteobacteria bacterium]|nr:hypothetical protein [Pseudomonadota bacterium]
MLDLAAFRDLILRPTLVVLELHSPAAENLLVGTALHESGLAHLRQMGGGPALGVFQIEPATHDDLWRNTLRFRPELAARAARLAAAAPSRVEQLATNLAYASAICRLLYWRVPEPLPAADDVDGLGRYWKRHYNTERGKGRAEDWAAAYRRHATTE